MLGTNVYFVAIQVCLGAVLKGAHQFSLELLDQEQKVAWPFRGCRDHSERQNRLATFGHFFSWSLGHLINNSGHLRQAK